MKERNNKMEERIRRLIEINCVKAVILIYEHQFDTYKRYCEFVSEQSKPIRKFVKGKIYSYMLDDPYYPQLSEELFHYIYYLKRYFKGMESDEK